MSLVISLVANLYAQDTLVKQTRSFNGFVHAEGGFLFPNGDMKDGIAIRQNLSSYYVDQSSDGEVNSSNIGFFAGLRYELFSTKLKTGLSSGLRYIVFASEVSGQSSSTADFVYLRYSMLNSDTKFARVKSINEIKNMICIPVEMTFVPLQFKEFGLFVKAGAEFSAFMIKNETTIDFQQSNMKVYEKEILKSMGATSGDFYSSFYSSLGLKVGKPNKTNLVLEVFLPSFYMSDNNFSLMHVRNYGGLKGSLQFSLNKSN